MTRSVRARVVALLMTCALLLGVATLPTMRVSAAPAPYLGLVNLGMPTAPQPFMPSDFAITKHFRQSSGNVGGGYGPPADSGNETMTADHGADCSAPPATHTVGTGYADVMFVCHDHVMTAINSGAYGELQFQPAQLVDFTNGPATVSISVSTFRASVRDWIDWMFVPFAEQLAVNTDYNVPEAGKLPMDSVRLGQTPGGCFCLDQGEEWVNGVSHDLSADWWTNVNDLIPASKTVRTPVVITISRTHLTEVMAGHTFVDTDFPVPLPFTQAVFQVMHHSYSPTKDGSGVPATWHWSDLSISTAVPYSLSMAMPDAAGDYAWLGKAITFSAAPAGAFLRAQWFNADLSSGANGSVSFDGGVTWHALAVQRVASVDTVGSADVANLWQPVPAGATSALFRGASGWYARDFYVMALASTGGTPAPSPTAPVGVTATPTAMPMPPTPTPLPPTPTPSPTPTPVAITNVPCTVVLNGVTLTGTCSGTFIPH